MRKANKKLMVGIGIVGTIALAGLLAMNVNAQPSGFVFIDENGNGQFDAGEWNSTSIQDAVDNASNGDTIYVWDGHYYEDVTVNKTVTIIGNTTIDAMSHSYGKNTSLEYDEFGFWVEADNVNISGFYMWCMGYDRSGIHLNGTQYCNISGNMISGDPSDGICIENSSHNMIYNNIISQNGIGITVVNSTWNEIYKNDVSDNENAGIYIAGNWSWLFSWNTISNNNISYNYIGVELYGTDNETITGNSFFYNSENGIYLENCENITIENNDFFNNTGNSDIYCEASNNTVISGNTFFGNGVPSYAIDMGGCISGLIDGNEMRKYGTEAIFTEDTIATISHNYMADSMWGIEPYDSTLVIFGNTIENGSEDGIDVYDGANLTIYDNIIANFGNGIYCDNDDPDTLFVAYDNTITDCENGILVEYCNKPNEIYNNTLTENGYGAYLEYSSNNVLSGNTITNNSCGIYLLHSSYNNITDNYIAENYGDTGIYIDEDSNHTVIVNNTIKNNQIGIYVYGGNMSVGYENVDTQIHYNDIYGNWMYGLIYDINEEVGTPWINATYNWWGSANGPDSNGGNQQDPITLNYAEGEGDRLYGNHSYDNIHFDPWLGLMLYKGWNLITPAFNYSVRNASDLMAMIPNCTVVTMWDNVNQKYVSYVDGFGENFEIINGSGYFVFVTEDVNVQFLGKLYQPTINMTLYPGYNLIGWPYIMYSPAKDIADNITHCIKVSKWDSQEQTWVAEYITALGSYNFDMLMGEGAFVFVSGQSQWQVEPWWWV